MRTAHALPACHFVLVDRLNDLRERMQQWDGGSDAHLVLRSIKQCDAQFIVVVTRAIA